MIIIRDLKLDRRETSLLMNDANRNIWEVFTDDFVLMRRLDKICEACKVENSGGKHCSLPAD